MTCASCADRIEKKLNKLDGVTATVNYATEKAKVTFPEPRHARRPDRAPSSRPGYAAALPRRRAAEDGRTRPPTTRPASLRQPAARLARCSPSRSSRWRWSRRCSSTYWQWLSLTLAAPVVVWGGWPFHRAAWTNLRHGAATMDTLVSLGTLAAFGWSLYALFLGHRRRCPA